MTLEQNVEKFRKVVKANPEKLTDAAITETVRAIVAADTMHIGDETRERYEHLGLQSIAECGVPEFRNVCLGKKSWNTAISAVMQMRIMCDVLTLCLDSEGVDFAMRYSADVAKAMGQRERTKRVDYVPFDICEKILDYYVEKLGDSWDASLKVVFEQTSEFLEGLHKVQLVADKEVLVVTANCVRDLWLPAEYKSFGFDVCTTMPSKFKAAEGNIVSLVEMNNFASIMDVLIRAVTRTKVGTTACMLFVSRIDEMCCLSRDLVPVGTKVDFAIHSGVYKPSHFFVNDTVRVMYRRLIDDSASLSADSVRNLEQIIFRYYEARKVGVV